jgi:hypothetical protein
MAMKETVGSLRAYFLIAGALSAASALSDIGELKELKGLELPLNITLAIYVPIIVRMLVGLGFIGAGLVLKKQLATGAALIKNLVLVATFLMVLDAGLIVWAIGVELGQKALLYTGIGIAIAIYLYASVARLSREAMAAK